MLNSWENKHFIKNKVMAKIDRYITILINNIQWSPVAQDFQGWTCTGFGHALY